MDTSNLLNFIHSNPFYELSLLLIFASFVGFIGQFAKQPLIVSFIVVGILSGPFAFDIIKDKDNVELLAELGIAVLLFVVGLKLDIKLIKNLGYVSLATGLGQVFFTSIVGFFIGIGLGLDYINSIYIAVALTFSSTIIIVKLLSDKREVDSLHGRIAIGFLIVQDLVVVISMIFLSTFGITNETEQHHLTVLDKTINLLLILCTVTVITYLFVQKIANTLMRYISKSSELMLIFGISWAALLASIGSYVGFSKELGALIAGISLASTPFRELLFSKLNPLRDFLLLFFFVSLGGKLEMDLIANSIFPAIVFSLFVLIGNPLIVMVIMGFMGYRKRTGFLCGLTVAQISEFSLIFIAMGVTLGHIGNDSLGLVTLVGLITIASSIYMITYSQVIYDKIEGYLNFFEKKHLNNNELKPLKNKKYDAVIFGMGRYGKEISSILINKNLKVLGIDFNPEEIKKSTLKGAKVIYGDACDNDFLESLNIHNIKYIISAMPQRDFGLTHEDPRIVLIKGLKSMQYDGKIIVSTQHEEEEKHLLKAGADLVLLPYHDAAEMAVENILKTN